MNARMASILPSRASFESWDILNLVLLILNLLINLVAIAAGGPHRRNFLPILSGGQTFLLPGTLKY